MSEIPKLDTTINGVPVELPDEFWEMVWEEVVNKIIEEGKKGSEANGNKD